MIYVILNEPNFSYDFDNLLGLFYTKSQFKVIGVQSSEFNKCFDGTYPDLNENDNLLTVSAVPTGVSSGLDEISYDSANSLILSVKLYDRALELADSIELTLSNEHDGLFKKAVKNKLKLMTYDLLSKIKMPSSPWGILVGIRPVKIVHELLDEGKSIEEIEIILKDNYRIEDEKIELITDIAIKERGYLYPIDKNDISLYICIPFCKTKCLYCSFPSNPLDKKKKLVEPYLEALLKEIDMTVKAILNSGKRIDCIYIGGGTPTAFTKDQLERIMLLLSSHIDLSELKEFTVEAGRPDTIDEDKLMLFKNHHVSRLCINPQTMNDETLKKIGRTHNSKDIEEIYQLASKIGFKNINMDLIIGLVDEKLEDYVKTLDKVVAMKPTNVTVHTLAVKRSSILNEFREDYELTEAKIVESMGDHTIKVMADNNYMPYYMYRQKNILANLENVGYSLPGHESLYNMRIMEERHTIIALGAGSASKFCYPNENRFERFSNSKGVEDYIVRIDELIESKLKMLTLLD